MMDILGMVVNVIVEIAGPNGEGITEDSEISEIMDSLDDVEFLMMIEEEFEIDIDESELNGIKTVGDIVKLIKEKCSKK